MMRLSGMDKRIEELNKQIEISKSKPIEPNELGEIEQYDLYDALGNYQDDLYNLLFNPPNKCPFDFKPNLNIPKSLRRKYRLHCLICHQEFECPAYVLRDQLDHKPYCYGCYSDHLEIYKENQDIG